MDDAWEASELANSGGTAATATGDPDGDGVDNLTEFAFNGDPEDGSDRGGIVSALADTNGNSQRELTFSVPVRAGAVFAAGANGSQAATVGSVTYTILGSLDLSSFTGTVERVSSTASGDPAYELHTFRLVSSEGLAGKGFLQARVALATP